MKKIILTLLFLTITLLLIFYKEKIISKTLNILDPYYKFTEIYSKNYWHKGSGYGSLPANAKPYLTILQDAFNNPDYKTYYDLGCGDWQLMSTINIPTDKQYFGFDVVKTVIENNIKNYSNKNVHFSPIKNLEEFYKYSGDLLIVKDVLQHLPNDQIIYFRDNILPKFKYALITNDYSLDSIDNNKNVKYGEWRPLDLMASPFNFTNLQILKEYHAHDANHKRVYLYTAPK